MKTVFLSNEFFFGTADIHAKQTTLDMPIWRSRLGPGETQV